MAATELIDYKFVDNGADTAEMSEVEIISDLDRYDGVRITFGKVSVQEIDKDDQAKLSFDFHVTNREPSEKYLLENEPTFQNLVGDILLDILYNAVETGDYNIGRTSED